MRRQSLEDSIKFANKDIDDIRKSWSESGELKASESGELKVQTSTILP